MAIFRWQLSISFVMFELSSMSCHIVFIHGIKHKSYITHFDMDNVIRSQPSTLSKQIKWHIDDITDERKRSIENRNCWIPLKIYTFDYGNQWRVS